MTTSPLKSRCWLSLMYRRRLLIESLLNPESSKAAKGNPGIGCLSLSAACVCPFEKHNKHKPSISMNGLICLSFIPHAGYNDHISIDIAQFLQPSFNKMPTTLPNQTYIQNKIAIDFIDSGYCCSIASSTKFLFSTNADHL